MSETLEPKKEDSEKETGRIHQTLTREQIVAIAARNRVAKRLDTGSLSSIGDGTVDFFIGEYGTPGDAVVCFSLQEDYFQHLSYGILSGTVRIMLINRLGYEEYKKHSTAVWRRKNSFITRARHLGDQNYRETMDATRRTEEVRFKRAEFKRDWAARNPDKVKFAADLAHEGAKAARVKQGILIIGIRN